MSEYDAELEALRRRRLLELQRRLAEEQRRAELQRQAELARRAAEEIAWVLNVETYLGLGGKVYHFSRLALQTVRGWELFGAPLLIAMLNTLMILMASVTERREEIRIISYLGATPRTVVLIFASEVLIYLTVSATLGYMGGLSLNIALVKAGLLPKGFIPNTSSLAVVLMLAVLFLVVLVPVLAVVSKTIRIAAPSLERGWKIPTRPVGNVWTIPFPFTYTSAEEAAGVMNYIAEYLRAHVGEMYEGFQVTGMEVDRKRGEIRFEAMLAPLEAGIRQRVTLRFSRDPTGKFRVGLVLSGSPPFASE